MLLEVMFNSYYTFNLNYITVAYFPYQFWINEHYFHKYYHKSNLLPKASIILTDYSTLKVWFQCHLNIWALESKYLFMNIIIF